MSRAAEEERLGPGDGPASGTPSRPSEASPRQDAGRTILAAQGLGKRYGTTLVRLGRLSRLASGSRQDPPCRLVPEGAAPSSATVDGLPRTASSPLGARVADDPRRDPSGGFWAVRDVDFDLAPGQSLGLVGRNGSGKSTLLRLLAGTARPTEGRAIARAPLACLLQLGAGFHALETGRENAEGWLVLQGGMSRREARAAAVEVERFAGIGPYFDRPLRTCSSGMQLRVAFATATLLRPRILVTDEVLAVGDEAFQRRCNRWFDGFLAGGGTLVLCAHDLFQVQRLCERAIWLDAGRVREFGPTREVIREYRRAAGSALAEEPAAGSPDAGTAHPVGERAGLEFEVVDMHLRDGSGAEIREIDPGQDLVVEVDVHAPIAVPHVHVSFVREDGAPVYGVSSDMDHARPRPLGGHRHRFRLRFPALRLLPGRYHARSHALDETATRLYDTVQLPLVVRGESPGPGLVELDARWEA